MTPENEREVIYSDLLQRLMVFINNIRGNMGMWREHLELIRNLLKTIHLFYMPEVHSYLVPMLIDFVFKGNNYIKELACQVLAKILKYQHHSPSRDELLAMINKDLLMSNNWKNRRSYIFFCKHAVRLMSIEFFKTHFMKEYLKLATDRVPSVRMEFVNSLLVIKPYFDDDQDLSLEMMDILSNLQSDPDRDVIEAVEHTDFELLQKRLKSKAKGGDGSDAKEETDEERVAF